MLRHRIAGVGTNQPQASAAYLPVGQPPGAPDTDHAWVITYHPVGEYPWGTTATMAYQDLTPIFAADGPVVSATTPGPWGHVYAAGRP
jgi:hypothetical protein